MLPPISCWWDPVEGAARGWPGLEGAWGDMSRGVALPWPERQGGCSSGRKRYKQEAAWMEEVWGAWSYFLDPDQLLGSSQREEMHETEFELGFTFESIWFHFTGEQSESQKH